MNDDALTEVQPRQDDDKTIRDERIDDNWGEKKTSEDDERVEAAIAVDTEERERLVDPADDYPDGGLRAWLCAIGCYFGNVATFGYVNSWGIFQTFYENNTLQDYSPSTIAWIGSIQYSFVFLPGIVIGRLFDMGIMRVPLAFSSIMLVVSTLLVAECHEYWQFLLCQGFATGLFAGMAFGPLVPAATHWFKRKRGLVLGILAFGSATGGTLFPIAVQNLIDEVGLKWTMRILALIILFCLTVTNLCIARRLPPSPRPGRFFDLKAFKSAPYTTYCATGFTSFLGLYTVQTYIDVSAAFVGVNGRFSLYLVSIANAGSAVGRVSSGYLVDIFGPLNVIIPFTLVAAAMSYGWPFITSKGGYIALALVYGASSGVYASMLAAPIVVVGGSEDVGLRVGMFFTIVAMGALAGPPISGAINTSTGNFKAVGYYAGSSILLAVILLITTRQFVLGRRIWGKA